MTEKVEIGKEYFHYKDISKRYRVLHIGKLQINDERYDLSEYNLAEVVIYEVLYEDAPLGKIWVRTLSEFKEKFTEIN